MLVLGFGCVLVEILQEVSSQEGETQKQLSSANSFCVEGKWLKQLVGFLKAVTVGWLQFLLSTNCENLTLIPRAPECPGSVCRYRG